MAKVEELVNPIVASHGYTVKYGGQFEAQQSASRTIVIFSGIVVLIMLVLLNLAIKSLPVALLVLVNLPLALIGGVVAIFLTESPSIMGNTMALFGIGGTYTAPVISIASMVGFITLFGIAVRNGILLVNHYKHLIEEEGATMDEAIVRGSQERLVPTTGIEQEFLDTLNALSLLPHQSKLAAQVDKLKHTNYADVSDLEKQRLKEMLQEKVQRDERRSKPAE